MTEKFDFHAAFIAAGGTDRIVCVERPEPLKKPGRKPLGEKPLTRKEHKMREKKKMKTARLENIAVLDFETDPFDNVSKETIHPFAACLYADNIEPVIIWEEDHERFIEAVIRAISNLPGRFTIYAHNGGKFDFMFLVSRLRGEVSFKGRSIMSAKIGVHDLRDSFHIIPEKLAAFQKDAFDYSKLRRDARGAYRDEIIRYMTNDCRYLLDIVKSFLAEFGIKLSIGQAAMSVLKSKYDVKKFTDGWDQYVRNYFYGGRVECLRGRGSFSGKYKLYDVNSMYPFVMATRQHPVGAMQDYKLRMGAISEKTVFIDLECDNNGALIGRAPSGETTARIKNGRFFTTIWEFETAAKYNLISNVKINYCLDCNLRTDFSEFVLPLYDKRQTVKKASALLKASGQENSAEWIRLKKDDIFLKLLLNNAYGKFAQNPRRFKDYYLTDPNEYPPEKWFASLKLLPEDQRKFFTEPHYEDDRYWIFQKPAPGYAFNNVGTAASITGAARAVLLEALQHARNPIYCDTDSIIAEELNGVPLHASDLGAWDIEDIYSKVAIAGKKLYSVWHDTPKKRTPEQLKAGLSPEYTIKSKGTAGIVWADMDAMLRGEVVATTSKGPSLDRYGNQKYIERQIRATAPIFDHEEF